MTEWPSVDLTDPTGITERRDEVVAAVREHTGQIAY